MTRLSYEQALAQNGFFAGPPVGTSMLPLLRQNEDVVVIRRCETVRLLDVVLFRRSNGQTVLHRVVGKRKGTFVLRGDNQIRSERGVTEDQIIGVMDAFYRKGKRHEANAFGIRLFGAVWWLIFPARYLGKYCAAIPYYLRRAAGKKRPGAGEN